MRHERKNYKDNLEKEVRREYKEWKDLPHHRLFCKVAGDFVKLKKPILNGYDLILVIELKDSDDRKKILEECYSVLYIPIHSSGKEFRKCDCRKSMKYRARDDIEFDSYFTNNKLDFEKVSHYVQKSIREYLYEKLSDKAKKYFTQCPAYDWHGNLLKNQYNYKFHDDDHIPFHFEVKPHYITYQFIPNGKIISRSDFLDKRLWTSMLWYTVLSEGDNYSSARWETRLHRKAQDRKDFEEAMQEFEAEKNGSE